MKQVEVVIKSTSPMLMHNIRLANPLDAYARKLGELNKAKRVKGADKDEFLDQIARVEWEGGLYHTATEQRDDGMGPYLPAKNLHQSIHEAAKMTREGAAVREGVFQPVDKRFRLDYDGPRDVQAMYDAGSFVDVRMVDVSGSKVPRARPIFYSWRATVRFYVNPEICDPARFIELIKVAGAFKGIGDGRQGVMQMGRFEVAE